MVEVTEDFKNHLDGMEPDATLTVIVMAKQHPDLEGLLQGASRAERRRIMVRKNTEALQPLIDYLDAQGVPHRALYHVRAIVADLTPHQVYGLAGEDAVLSITGDQPLKLID